MQYYGCPEVCDYDEDPPSCNLLKIYFLTSLTTRYKIGQQGNIYIILYTKVKSWKDIID